MRWMKLTNDHGAAIYCNMACAVTIYERASDGQGNPVKGAHIALDNGEMISVTEMPDEIVARGEWLVK